MFELNVIIVAIDMNFDKVKSFIIIGIIFFSIKNVCCQEYFFNPLFEDSYKEDVKFLNKVNILKEHITNSELYLYNSPQMQDYDSLPLSFKNQIVVELIELHIKHKTNLWENEIYNFAKTTFWRKEILLTKLYHSKLQSKYPADFDSVISFINKNYDSLYLQSLNECKNKDILNQIFWVNTVWQRDQDFRKYFTYSFNRDSLATEILFYFDSINLKSILSFIKKYNYPSFTMGTYYFNFTLLHFNNPKILTVKDFNFIHKKIWESVLLGNTSLIDYCYLIDRYLVENLKKEPVYGLYYPNDVRQETINMCVENRKKIGLKI